MASGTTSWIQVTWTTANTVMVAGLVQTVHGWKNTMVDTGAVTPKAGGTKTLQAGTHSPSTCGSTELNTGSIPVVI